MDFAMTLWGTASDASAMTHLLTNIGRFLIVLIGINALIIVHEFGHFIVARMCGVRCEKFYIWFDAWGFKLFHFKWGDTEYGLGWLPLGGYVKMLGQEDNPGGIQEEIERAKVNVEQAEKDSEESAAAAEKLKDLEEAVFAPDSYQAKNVFQRMAIISAGVIMNVIFAIICAALAFQIGFPETTSRIGTVMPGGSAWKAALRAGDVITELNHQEVTLFSQIPYGLIDGGTVALKAVRNETETLERDIVPIREKSGMMPVIGILPATSLQLAKIDRPYSTSLNAAENERYESLFGTLEGGDLLVSMNGEVTASPSDYERLLRKYLNEPITFVFAPTDKKGAVLADQPTKSVTAPVLAVKETGIRLSMGEIVAVQSGSPAEKVGFAVKSVDSEGNQTAAGDILLALDSETITDPTAVPSILRQKAKAGNPVVVTVRRGGETVDIPVTLNADAGYTGILSHNGIMASDALGVAFEVNPVVSGMDASVTALSGEKKPGGKIEQITVALPALAADASDSQKAFREQLVHYGTASENGFVIDAGTPDTDENRKRVLDWFAQGINYLPDGVLMDVALLSPNGERSVVQTAVSSSADRMRIDRGLTFGVETKRAKAASFAEAASYGWNKTVESMGLVFRVLKNIGRNVSAKAFGGPGMIVGAAWTASGTGDGLFFVFLCIISANLAVVNILPIPVLDGGHLVFLLYEAIFRKPANETVQVILSYIGLTLLLALMAWVILLDIARYSGWL